MIAVAPFVLALVAAVPQQPAAIEVVGCERVAVSARVHGKPQVAHVRFRNAMRQPRRSSVYGSANVAL
jgi:hypothetical protein